MKAIERTFEPNQWVLVSTSKKSTYYAHPNGELKSVSTNGLETALKGCIHPRGYRKIKIPGQSESFVHRIIAKTFIPNPKGLKTVNHIDGDKLNNAVANLEWLSYEDNNLHAAQVLGLTKMYPVEVHTSAGIPLGIFKSRNYVKKQFGDLRGLVITKI